MPVIAAAAAALLLVLALLAWILLRRPNPGAETARDPALDGPEAAEHFAKALALVEAKKDPEWNRKACKHLVSALKLGHNDGEAAETLAIVLETTGYPRQAMEVCKLVLDDGFRMRKGARLGKKDFQIRLERYRERHHGPVDGLPLFTPEEAVAILRASRQG